MARIYFPSSLFLGLLLQAPSPFLVDTVLAFPHSFYAPPPAATPPPQPAGPSGTAESPISIGSSPESSPLPAGPSRSTATAASLLGVSPSKRSPMRAAMVGTKRTIVRVMSTALGREKARPRLAEPAAPARAAVEPELLDLKAYLQELTDWTGAVGRGEIMPAAQTFTGYEQRLAASLGGDRDAFCVVAPGWPPLRLTPGELDLVNDAYRVSAATTALHK